MWPCWRRFHEFVWICCIFKAFSFHKSSGRTFSREIAVSDSVNANTSLGFIWDKLVNFPSGPFRVYLGDSNLPGLMDFFTVNDEGELRTLKKLDRDDSDAVCGPLQCCSEEKCYVIFDCIFAPGYSAGLYSQNIRVNVTVILEDLNDNSPQFSQPQYTLSVPEADMYLQLLELPLAQDADSRKNGVKQYKLMDRNMRPVNQFSLKTEMSGSTPISKLHINRSLDFEKPDGKEFFFVLIATDNDIPRQLSGTTVIHLKVTDENDNSPEFANPSIEISVSENHTISLPVYRVNVTDRDSGTNGQLTFSFGSFRQPSNADKKFHINGSTGEIFLKGTLDYEKPVERRFILPVVARDGGNPPRSATMTVTLSTLDVNDNSPVVRVTKNNTVAENTPPPEEVLNLHVSDADEISKGKVTCSHVMQPGDVLRLKKMADTVYVVETTTTLDYETHQRVSITISCTDGTLTSTHVLVVAVLDLNDNSPRFTELCPIEREIPENLAVNVTLESFRVQARDMDSGHFGKVTYGLSRFHTFEEEIFAINEVSGELYLLKSVDRETSSLHRVTIEAVDGGQRTSTCEMQIKVLDFNDMAPEMTSSPQMSVVEHSPIRHRVGAVVFQDRDLGVNAQYHLTFDTTGSVTNTSWRGLLELNAQGEILIQSDLDREKLGEWLQVKVLAIDHGSPPLSATSTISIHLLDLNDCSPQLLYPVEGSLNVLSPGSVTVGSPWNTPVLQLNATDPDNGLNGTVRFSMLVGGNGSHLFQVNSTTGLLTTNWRPRSPPEPGVYYVEVALNDLGVPKHHTSKGIFYLLLSAAVEDASESRARFISFYIFHGIVGLIFIAALCLLIGLIIAIITFVKGRHSSSGVSQHTGLDVGDPFLDRGDYDTTATAQHLLKMMPGGEGNGSRYMTTPALHNANGLHGHKGENGVSKSEEPQYVAYDNYFRPPSPVLAAVSSARSTNSHLDSRSYATLPSRKRSSGSADDMNDANPSGEVIGQSAFLMSRYGTPGPILGTPSAATVYRLHPQNYPLTSPTSGGASWAPAYITPAPSRHVNAQRLASQWSDENGAICASPGLMSRQSQHEMLLSSCGMQSPPPHFPTMSRTPGPIRAMPSTGVVVPTGQASWSWQSTAGSPQQAVWKPESALPPSSTATFLSSSNSAPSNALPGPAPSNSSSSGYRRQSDLLAYPIPLSPSSTNPSTTPTTVMGDPNNSVPRQDSTSQTASKLPENMTLC